MQKRDVCLDVSQKKMNFKDFIKIDEKNAMSSASHMNRLDSLYVLLICFLLNCREC